MFKDCVEFEGRLLCPHWRADDEECPWCLGDYVEEIERQVMPCSGQRTADGRCFTCGHATDEHDAKLVCRTCRAIERTERSIEADTLAWWRSQQ